MGWELRASPTSHGRHASRCPLRPQTSLPWRPTFPPNPEHLGEAGSSPREMKQGGRGPSRPASRVPKPRTPGGRSRGGGGVGDGGGHGLPRCSRRRPPRSRGLGGASRWSSPRDGREMGPSGTLGTECPSQHGLAGWTPGRKGGRGWGQRPPTAPVPDVGRWWWGQVTGVLCTGPSRWQCCL